MNKFFDLLLKIYQIIKPSFHNRVTWTLIIAGLSFMSTSVLVEIVNHILKKEFDFTITGENDTFWGFMLCLIALIYNALLNIISIFNEKSNIQEKKEQQQMLLEHDKNLFQRLEHGLQEAYFKNIIEQTATNHAICWNEVSALESFVRANQQASNQFLSPEISCTTQILVTNIDKFLKFQCEHFDCYPYHQTDPNFRTCLAPQWNVDRGGRWEDGGKYDPLADEMFNLLNAMSTSYDQWRATVKIVLFI